MKRTKKRFHYYVVRNVELKSKSRINDVLVYLLRNDTNQLLMEMGFFYRSISSISIYYNGSNKSEPEPEASAEEIKKSPTVSTFFNIFSLGPLIRAKPTDKTNAIEYKMTKIPNLDEA